MPALRRRIKDWKCGRAAAAAGLAAGAIRFIEFINNFSLFIINDDLPGGGRHSPGDPVGGREAASHPDGIHAWVGRRDHARRQKPGRIPHDFSVTTARRPRLAAARTGTRSHDGHHPSKATGTSRGGIRGGQRRAGNFRWVTVGYVRLQATPKRGRKPGRAFSRIPKVNNNCTRRVSGSMAQPGRAPDS